MTDVLLVTGMSGAGRSTVSSALDDLGWFVIDNLPIEVLVRVGELASATETESRGVAFIVGRSGQHHPEELLEAKRELEVHQPGVKILFLDAPDDVLIHRYEGTRRRHPFPGATLADSIETERAVLAPLRDAADIIIDTGTTNTNQLRTRILEIFGVVGRAPLRVSVMSFGYSHGLPRDVDLVFDCRFLPNPHWVPELQPLTGLDQPVADYVLSHEPAQHFVRDVVSMLEWQIPAFAEEGKSYLTIAVGCTGGKHRSVAIAEELRRRLHLDTEAFHRDVAR
ncbi:MAG: RNase adapter RapZ [Acidobacteria bacterium]|jgi:UPF0042 nucleotide-binding protein|nr:RNase adapter RapZ [Acidobacteriota bacterium]